MLATGAAIVSSSAFASTGATLAKRTALAPVITIAAGLVDAILLVALVPPFGLRGAGVAVMVSYLVLFVGSFAYSLRVNPAPWSSVGVPLVLMALAGQALVASVKPASGASILCGALAVAAAALVLRSQWRLQHLEMAEP